MRPFIDDNGLIRVAVAGRFDSSDLEYALMHPVVLPRNDHIVNLLTDYYHIKYLHAGPELMMSLLRQKFQQTKSSYVQHLFQAQPASNLYISHATNDKVITHSGCDYAGPIPYTPVRRRGVRSKKAYICLFTCLTTRVVHIEVAAEGEYRPKLELEFAENCITW